MNLSRRLFSRSGVVLGAVVLVFFTGCENFLLVKQKVLIDAISAAGIPPPSGQSYRLVARKSVVTGQQAQLPVIKACIDAALLHQGLYEAPPNVPSDIFIEINYGMDTSSRVDPSTRESFLQLSARANRNRSLETSHEEELWDVRAAVAGVAGRLETAMPLLATMAAKYAGADTRVETVLAIADSSPDVVAVRENAVKNLSTHAAQAPAATPAVAPR